MEEFAVTPGGVGGESAVVAHEEYYGVVLLAVALHPVHEVAQTLVHTLNERGVSSLLVAQAFAHILREEAFVAVDRYVYGVVRHIQKEGLIVFLSLVECSYCFLGECFGDESSGSPVFLQTRYGHQRSRFAVLGMSVVELAQVSRESAGSMSGNVHFKSPVCRILARGVHSAEMRLAAMYGVIAAVAQQFYERCAHVGVWSACHLRYAVDVPVGTVNHVAREVHRLVAFECPVGHTVACVVGARDEAASRR